MPWRATSSAATGAGAAKLKPTATSARKDRRSILLFLNRLPNCTTRARHIRMIVVASLRSIAQFPRRNDMSRSAESYLRLVRIPIVVVLLGLLVVRLRRQQYPDLRGERQGEVVGRAQPVPAPRRPHPQPGRDREGLCRARAPGAGGGDRRAGARHPESTTIPADVVTNPEAFKRFQEAQAAALRRAGAAAGGVGALSGPEGEPELSRAAIAARRHREPHRGRAPRLHRGGAHLQHRAAHVSGRDLGVDALPQRQADGDLHGGGRRARGRRP